MSTFATITLINSCQKISNTTLPYPKQFIQVSDQRGLDYQVLYSENGVQREIYYLQQNVTAQASTYPAGYPLPTCQVNLVCTDSLSLTLTNKLLQIQAQFNNNNLWGTLFNVTCPFYQFFQVQQFQVQLSDRLIAQCVYTSPFGVSSQVLKNNMVYVQLTTLPRNIYVAKLIRNNTLEQTTYQFLDNYTIPTFTPLTPVTQATPIQFTLNQYIDVEDQIYSISKQLAINDPYPIFVSQPTLLALQTTLQTSYQLLNFYNNSDVFGVRYNISCINANFTNVITVIVLISAPRCTVITADAQLQSFSVSGNTFVMIIQGFSDFVQFLQTSYTSYQPQNYELLRLTPPFQALVNGELVLNVTQQFSNMSELLQAGYLQTASVLVAPLQITCVSCPLQVTFFRKTTQKFQMQTVFSAEILSLKWQVSQFQLTKGDDLRFRVNGQQFWVRFYGNGEFSLPYGLQNVQISQSSLNTNSNSNKMRNLSLILEDDFNTESKQAKQASSQIISAAKIDLNEVDCSIQQFQLQVQSLTKTFNFARNCQITAFWTGIQLNKGDQMQISLELASNQSTKMVFTQNLTAGQISAISQDLSASEPQQYYVWYLQNGVAENNKTTALVASAAVVLVVLLVIIAVLTFCLFRKKSINTKKVAKSSILADSRLKAKNPIGRAPTANSNSVSPALKSRGKQLRPITGKQTVNQPIMLPNELQIQPIQQPVQPVQNNHTSPVMRFSVQKENSDSNFFMTQTKIENPPNLKTDQTFSNSNIPNYTADKAENVEPHDTNETKERKRKRKKHVRKEGGDDMSSDKQE